MRGAILMVVLAACGSSEKDDCLVLTEAHLFDAQLSSDLNCVPCPGSVSGGMCVTTSDAVECRAADRCDSVVR